MLLLRDLLPLQDVLDEIIPDEEVEDDQDYFDLYDTIIELIDEYVLDNPTEISEPDFEEVLFDELLDLLELTNSQVFGELEETIEYAMEQYFSTVLPPRSHPDTFTEGPIDCDALQNQIDYLKTKPQPAQRTPAWYAFRRNLITASNAYKAFESQSSRNQLIYEKCKPDVIPDPTVVEVKQVNTETSLHWGQKYEPVSVALYEYIYDTKVGDFGCIQHDKYSFIGASPDGINILQSSPRFGRMLEIKNVVSREIDGIPKKEYWIQMQLQMETCNLDECDFLETQFNEYETHAAFMLDVDTKYRGIILQFATEFGGLKYIYSPVGLTTEELEMWENENVKANELFYCWICTHYWKVETISCVLVERNRQWFNDNLSGLADLWDTVLEERECGYEHRAPNSNKKQIVEVVSDCLFIPNKDGKIM
jgi:putative phage-type endonuclease